MTAQRESRECLQPGCGNRTLSDDGYCHIATHDGRHTRSLSALTTVPDPALLEEQERDQVRIVPSDEQVQVRDRSLEVFKDPGRDRCQLRAACGMGKTIMAEMALDAYDDHLQVSRGRSGTYLVVAPTIKLARQLREDFVEDGVLDIDDESILSVHDTSEDTKVSRTDESSKLEADIRKIKGFLSQESESPRVIIAVRKSMFKVIEAQGDLNHSFDVTVFDEAHNYAGKVDASSDPSQARMLFNEQKGGLQSDNRMFMSATPEYDADEVLESRVDPRVGRKVSLRSRILEQDRITDQGIEAGSLFLNQDDQEVFGESVGSWGYRHAIEKGYLTEPVISRSRLTIRSKTSSVDRNTLVDASGAESDDGVSLGAWVSASSTMDSVISNGGRNVLTFSDTIEEARAVKSSWADIARARAARELGPDNVNRLTSEQAYRVLHEGGHPDNVQRAARYTLLAEHAQVIVTSSKHPQSIQDEAMNHFDKKRLYDRGSCSCRKPGGWCACIRLVSNVDMLSEGISISSIDTVVFNRPRRSSDADIYQAIGRSSRVWRDDAGKNQKSQANVVIPHVETQDSSGIRSGALLSSEAGTLGAVSRIARDATGPYSTARSVEEDWADMATTDDPSGLYSTTDSLWPSFQGGEKIRAAVAMNRAWKDAENLAAREYRRSHPREEEFRQLPIGTKYALTRQAVQNEIAKSRGARSVVALSPHLRGMKPSHVEQFKALSRTLLRRGQSGDYVEDEGALALAQRSSAKDVEAELVKARSLDLWS